MTLAYANMDTTLIVVHLANANKNELLKLSISKFHQKYGAWAFNPKTGITGGALNMNSRDAAEREAIKTCEQGGRNKPCKIGVWVRNSCIAVAQGKLGKKVETFYGMEPIPGHAEPSALRKCQASGSSQCSIVVNEGCSLPKF